MATAMDEYGEGSSDQRERGRGQREGGSDQRGRG